MESANFHHHHQQEDHQLLVHSSCYGLSLYQNPILNGTSTNISMESIMANEMQHLARIKNELLVTGSHSELPEIISIEDFMSKNNHQRIRYNNDNNHDMLLKTFSNGCQIKNDHLINQIPLLEESNSYSTDDNSCYRGTFSQIFPTQNISSLNQPSTTTFNGSLSYQPSSFNVHNVGGIFKDNCLSYDLDQMYSKIPPSIVVESIEAKRRASNYLDAKAHKATPTKKSKLDLRPSCTPLKIRKEKLGDRISALQQMVAPFGKTDTASVLMEAIGYIKFLQNQVEGSIKNGNGDQKRDLRSRGLCLVPLSCLSYVTYGGGSVWATP